MKKTSNKIYLFVRKDCSLPFFINDNFTDSEIMVEAHAKSRRFASYKIGYVEMLKTTISYRNNSKISFDDETWSHFECNSDVFHQLRQDFLNYSENLPSQE